MPVLGVKTSQLSSATARMCAYKETEGVGSTDSRTGKSDPWGRSSLQP